MKKIIAAILLIIPFYASSQELIAYRDSVKDSYNFWVYVPECYDSVSGTTPTVLFATCLWCANMVLSMLF